MVKVPIDTHRSTSRVRNIAKWSKKQKWITFLRPDEQEKLRSVLFLAYVSLANCGVFTRRALGLPMEARRADSVVVVPGRRRESFLRLVQSHEKDLGIGWPNPHTTRLCVAGPDTIRQTQSDQNLVTCVLAM